MLNAPQLGETFLHPDAMEKLENLLVLGRDVDGRDSPVNVREQSRHVGDLLIHERFASHSLGRILSPEERADLEPRLQVWTFQILESDRAARRARKRRRRDPLELY
jgi:hypothetical protein